MRPRARATIEKRGGRRKIENKKTDKVWRQENDGYYIKWGGSRGFVGGVNQWLRRMRTDCGKKLKRKGRGQNRRRGKPRN